MLAVGSWCGRGRGQNDPSEDVVKTSSNERSEWHFPWSNTGIELPRRLAV